MSTALLQCMVDNATIDVVRSLESSIVSK